MNRRSRSTYTTPTLTYSLDLLIRIYPVETYQFIYLKPSFDVYFNPPLFI